jgi:hypothetical protein
LSECPSPPPPPLLYLLLLCCRAPITHASHTHSCSRNNNSCPSTGRCLGLPLYPLRKRVRKKRGANYSFCVCVWERDKTGATDALLLLVGEGGLKCAFFSSVSVGKCVWGGGLAECVSDGLGGCASFGSPFPPALLQGRNSRQAYIYFNIFLKAPYFCLLHKGPLAGPPTPKNMVPHENTLGICLDKPFFDGDNGPGDMIRALDWADWGSGSGPGALAPPPPAPAPPPY